MTKLRDPGFKRMRQLEAEAKRRGGGISMVIDALQKARTQYGPKPTIKQVVAQMARVK